MNENLYRLGVIAAALLGHAGFSIFLINRIHSLGYRRIWLKVADLGWYGFVIGVPCLWWLSAGASSPNDSSVAGELTIASASRPLIGQMAEQFASGYQFFAVVFLGLCVVDRVRFLCTEARGFRAGIVTYRRKDLSSGVSAEFCDGLLSNAFRRIPQNEILLLEVNEKRVAVPNLAAELEGLTIGHVSDLHLTGQLTKAFYHAVVDELQGLNADLMVLSGDIVEKSRCLSWIPETLGRLRAPCGVFFVLGNHEERIGNWDRVRRTLMEAELEDLAGRWVRRTIRGGTLDMTGTERPWARPAADIERAPSSTGNPQPLRLLVSHSPDQMAYARRHKFHLMLAGHTHGGQVRLPIVGPVLSPSRYGVRYAAGLFEFSDMTLHVSRGIAGTRPIRWGCPPEISKLILHSRGIRGSRRL